MLEAIHFLFLSLNTLGRMQLRKHLGNVCTYVSNEIQKNIIMARSHQHMNKN